MQTGRLSKGFPHLLYKVLVLNVAFIAFTGAHIDGDNSLALTEYLWKEA